MRAFRTAFEPEAVRELALITDSIVEERGILGIKVDALSRNFIAAFVIKCAVSGESDAETIKARARSECEY